MKILKVLNSIFHLRQWTKDEQKRSSNCIQDNIQGHKRNEENSEVIRSVLDDEFCSTEKNTK